MKIVIVDYGMGNVRSISGALKYIGADQIILSDQYRDLQVADKIILPGVGAFGEAMTRIRKKKLDIFLRELVIEGRKPLLGICLGMQLLGKSSTEHGIHEGLGFVEGQVVKMECNGLKVPHVGFNQVILSGKRTRLFQNFKKNADFYFTHSYKMIADSEINQVYCDYGGNFIASFELNNLAGVQFHPELSQHNGLSLLKNFITHF